MSPTFRDQTGGWTSDPPAIARWLTSRILSRVSSRAAERRRRERADRARRRAGAPHRIEYFHQLDDGYSHLAAQLLEPLRSRYDVEVVFHVVSQASGRDLPEPERLLELSRVDAACVAPHYRLCFPEKAAPADPALLERAAGILVAAGKDAATDLAVTVGDALWSNDVTAMDALASTHGCAEAADVKARIERGNARRAELGHYSGAMFHYGGEWFWGADRLYHLERRLIDLGARRSEGEELVCPRPPIEYGPLRDDGSLTLEIYPSLRSPYTAVIFEAALRLGEETGVRTVVRPVLPMVMRGVPVARQKGFYLFTDAAREARAMGLDWGPFYDPIGDPVRKAYSLHPWAAAQGKDAELIRQFLRAAFYEGRNTNREGVLRTVVERAGLDWDTARGLLGDRGWEEEIERNRLAMYAFGAWGVPSFRLLDERGEQVLALWGQDRLWLFSREIQRLLARRNAAS